MVFYRTYRPKTINELDKSDVRERITSLLQSDDIPHALLFTGTRGTGKTSTARIIAKALNCTKRTGVEPCNTCENCTAIATGTHLDVIEIDAASNRGIDEIRDLRERIALAPGMGTYKVYIIDEVHMLTREAFNALLKTLEEPPAHAVFMLATTEPQKLPDTIISRCTRIIFSKATAEELERSFQRIVKGETLTIEPAALSVIAQAADGSFRDGVKLLEQAVAEKKFTEQEVRSLIGSGSTAGLLTPLLNKKISDALDAIEELEHQGTDFTLLLQSLLEDLHIKLLEDPTNADLKKITQLLMRAYPETKTSPIPQLPLELAVIEYCNS